MNYPAKDKDNVIELVAHNIITLIALDIYDNHRQELIDAYGADIVNSAYEYCMVEFEDAIDNIKRIYNQYK